MAEVQSASDLVAVPPGLLGSSLQFAPAASGPTLDDESNEELDYDDADAVAGARDDGRGIYHMSVH